MRERWCWPPVVNAIGVAGGIVVVAADNRPWWLTAWGAALIAGNLALIAAWFLRSRRETRRDAAIRRYYADNRARNLEPVPRFAAGGTIPPIHGPGVPVLLEPDEITDPDHAEAAFTRALALIDQQEKGDE